MSVSQHIRRRPFTFCCSPPLFASKHLSRLHFGRLHLFVRVLQALQQTPFHWTHPTGLVFLVLRRANQWGLRFWTKFNEQFCFEILNWSFAFHPILKPNTVIFCVEFILPARREGFTHWVSWLALSLQATGTINSALNLVVLSSRSIVVATCYGNFPQLQLSSTIRMCESRPFRAFVGFIRYWAKTRLRKIFWYMTSHVSFMTAWKYRLAYMFACLVAREHRNQLSFVSSTPRISFSEIRHRSSKHTIWSFSFPILSPPFALCF
jgi:hypothetical protein